MKLSEFTRRARASRLEKKAKFEAAFERAKRDLKLPEANMTTSRRSVMHSYVRSDTPRPVLTLFPRNESTATSGTGK
jgi:hypothetical protein